MKLDIITKTQAKKIARDEVKKIQNSFWKETEKLRKRIVELEQKHMDIKNFKLVRKNEI